jgi:hypothetical protein
MASRYKAKLLRPEYSAQGMNAKPAPMLGRALTEIANLGVDRGAAVDLGCGQLRHLTMMLTTFRKVTLVDTPLQLSRELRFDGNSCTIADFIRTLPRRVQQRIKIIDSEQFGAANKGADVVLTINTFDVVPPKVRDEMCGAALQNVRRGGLLAVIIPRNDTTITDRCSDENGFLDGHVFEHHGAMTFFRNFREHHPLIRRIEGFGARLLSDLSVYRHICLLFECKGGASVTKSVGRGSRGSRK